MATTMAGAIRQIEGRWNGEGREAEVLRAAATPGRKTWAIVFRTRWTTERADASAREWSYIVVSVSRKESYGIGNFSYSNEELAVEAMNEYLDRAAENVRLHEAHEAKLREQLAQWEATRA